MKGHAVSHQNSTLKIEPGENPATGEHGVLLTFETETVMAATWMTADQAREAGKLLSVQALACNIAKGAARNAAESAIDSIKKATVNSSSDAPLWPFDPTGI